jgi:aryl-alcohol dehydrogenase-like predicted oxidoreductase
VQFGLDYGINNSNGKPRKEKVFEILRYAQQNGIKELDTADAYGNASELIGDFIRDSKTSFKINTKFKADSAILLEAQLHDSLKKLNIEQVNTYFFHRFSDLIEYPKIIDDLNLLKSKGLLVNIGISVYGNSEFEHAITQPGIDVIQLPFNLLDNYHQRGKYLEMARKAEKILQVRSVFLQGLFFMSLDTMHSRFNELKPFLAALHQIAENLSMSMEQLAMAYVVSQPLLDEVIIGVDNVNQLKQNLQASRAILTPEMIEKIDNIKVENSELLYPKNWN